MRHLGSIIGLAGIALAAYGVNQRLNQPEREALPSCYAVDGDTLACGAERIRILGVDAPEMGRCRRGRQCVTGDPLYARDVLSAVAFKPLTIERMGKDHYGRTLGHVYSGEDNAACTLIAAHAAAYIRQWDDRPEGRVEQECGL